MDVKTYQECALRTMADQQKILDRLVDLGPLAMQLDNGARGLADDAGEVSGVIKKHIEYGQALDIEHLKEELGDCFWRMLQICKATGITFEECFQANYDKLNKVRYKDGYSDEAAKEENRDRAAEREVMKRTDGECTPIAPSPDCSICEGTGQVGWKDASFNSAPCPKCYPEHKCPHKVKEMRAGGVAICIACGERFTEKEIGIKRPEDTRSRATSMPENWDKDPYSQTGAGWAEPNEEYESSLPFLPQIGSDGMCRCSCGDPCPLGRTGMELRCTDKQLMGRGIKFKPYVHCGPPGPKFEEIEDKILPSVVRVSVKNGEAKIDSPKPHDNGVKPVRVLKTTVNDLANLADQGDEVAQEGLQELATHRGISRNRVEECCDWKEVAKLIISPPKKKSKDKEQVTASPNKSAFEFTLARRIADSYIEGQNLTRALIEIDRAEAIYKEMRNDSRTTG